ncbi:MAG: hypothetical protein ACOC36_07840, partial [Fibrobacterota bacterium]
MEGKKNAKLLLKNQKLTPAEGQYYNNVVFKIKSAYNFCQITENVFAVFGFHCSASAFKQYIYRK